MRKREAFAEGKKEGNGEEGRGKKRRKRRRKEKEEELLVCKSERKLGERLEKAVSGFRSSSSSLLFLLLD